MNIVAVIGSESHTTSRGWASISVNGQKLSHREAVSKEFKTKYGDKHAVWVECVFKVQPGDTVTWEAGTNSGSRGADRKRQNLTFTVNPDAEVIETEALGYPASEAVLRGRLVPVADAVADAAADHRQMANCL